MLGSRVRLLDPVSAAWNTVARFDDYEAAQRAVDRLSDDGFPVEKLDIVDFSSVRQLVATRYDLIAREGTVDRARSMLSEAGLLPQTEAAR